MRCLTSGSVAAVALALTAAAARAEVVKPDDAEPEKKAPAKTEEPKRAETAPGSVDEPDFKAKVVGTQKAGTPQKETPTADVQPEEKATPVEAKEELSEALAKAISKERSGKPPKEMVPVYRAVVAAEGQSAAAHYRLGLALARNEEAAAGLAELERAVALQPANPKYLCDAGLVALQAGALDKALPACQKAAAAAPTNARCQSALGDCLLAAGRIVPAADAYRRAVQLAPENPVYIHNLGVAHIRVGAYKQAVEVLNEAIRLRPECAAFYCSRGLAQMSMGKGKEAIRDYTAALALERNNAYAHFLLASAYSDPNDPTYTSAAEAVEHAERAARLTEFKNAQYLMGFARALRVARKYEMAVEIAKKAIVLEPRDEFRKELSEFERLRNEGLK